MGSTNRAIVIIKKKPEPIKIVTDQDIELTNSDKGVIHKSPNGTQWVVQIDDDGGITSSEV